LRSKRAITSPVRARWKASGFTRISVRLTVGAPLGSLRSICLCRPLGCGRILGLLRGAPLWALLPLRRLRRLGRLGRGVSPWFGGAPRASLARRALALRPLGNRVLAVGTERPARVDRLAAARTRILEAALALRAAQVVLLHRV